MVGRALLLRRCRLLIGNSCFSFSIIQSTLHWTVLWFCNSQLDISVPRDKFLAEAEGRVG